MGERDSYRLISSLSANPKSMNPAHTPKSTPTTLRTSVDFLASNYGRGRAEILNLPI